MCTLSSASLPPIHPLKTLSRSNMYGCFFAFETVRPCTFHYKDRIRFLCRPSFQVPFLWISKKKKKNQCGTLLMYLKFRARGEKSQGIVLKHYITIIISMGDGGRFVCLCSLSLFPLLWLLMSIQWKPVMMQSLLYAGSLLIDLIN